MTTCQSVIKEHRQKINRPPASSVCVPDCVADRRPVRQLRAAYGARRALNFERVPPRTVEAPAPGPCNRTRPDVNHAMRSLSFGHGTLSNGRSWMFTSVELCTCGVHTCSGCIELYTAGWPTGPNRDDISRRLCHPPFCARRGTSRICHCWDEMSIS